MVQVATAYVAERINASILVGLYQLSLICMYIRIYDHYHRLKSFPYS